MGTRPNEPLTRGQIRRRADHHVRRLSERRGEDLTLRDAREELRRRHGGRDGGGRWATRIPGLEDEDEDRVRSVIDEEVRRRDRDGEGDGDGTGGDGRRPRPGRARSEAGGLRSDRERSMEKAMVLHRHERESRGEGGSRSKSRAGSSRGEGSGGRSRSRGERRGHSSRSRGGDDDGRERRRSRGDSRHRESGSGGGRDGSDRRRSRSRRDDRGSDSDGRRRGSRATKDSAAERAIITKVMKDEYGNLERNLGAEEDDSAEKLDYDKVSFLRRGFTQNIVAGMVAFTGPGLFNAMQGLGNAGGSDPKVAATMNATLYATFSIFGVLSGSLFNLLGTKILMSFGALTYGFYAISVYLWGQVDDSYAGMAIFASAVLGLGAACLWGAQGTMTLSYALENQKGLFFGLFWLIFNMGGVMGGFISLGLNSGPVEERASSVTPDTYFTFCGLMVAGALMAFFFVIRPGQVVKADGSPVRFEKTETAEGIGELKEVAKLFTNRYMLLLTPLIIQSNWFYAYEFGGINGLLFDAPTRGLNSALYWAVSGVSSYVCGTYYLDRESVGGRRQRAIRGLVVISAINVGQWLYAIIYQFSTGYDKGQGPDPPINYRDGGAYAGPMLLFLYCGLADSLVQTYAYWIIGAISNSPKTLSRYVGYYKGIQSFGACLAWIIEAEGTSYRAQLMICATLAVMFIPPTYVVATCVADKGSDDEDAKTSLEFSKKGDIV